MSFRSAEMSFRVCPIEKLLKISYFLIPFQPVWWRALFITVMKHITNKLHTTIFALFSIAFFVMPLLFVIADDSAESQNSPELVQPVQCQACEKDQEGAIREVIVDENVTVDFNTNPPTCAGDADLCTYFSYEKPHPADVKTWNAVFDLGGKKLVVKSETTISVNTIPLHTNKRKTPGLKILTDCAIVVEENAEITLRPHNTKGGDLYMQAGGDIIINGAIHNIGSGTDGVPGKTIITSCCGAITTGPASRITSHGTNPGGNDIYILAKENITLNGLIDAAYKGGRPANIHIFSTEGAITIDGNNSFGLEAGTQRPITSGVFVRAITEPVPGQINIHAYGDITILGNTILNSNNQNYGAVAVKTGSNDSCGGIIDVRSQNGNVRLFDRAIDNENHFNDKAFINIFAKHAVYVSVTDRIDAGASTNAKIVINNSAGRNGIGGANNIRSFSGAITVDAGAHIVSLHGPHGSLGVNNLVSCSGITNTGLINPLDINSADDSGNCSPAQPDYYDESNPIHNEFQYFLETYAGGALLCIFRDEEQPPQNTKPVITVLGANPLTITEGDTFTDPGATAHDAEDGDITDDIVIGGDTVNTNTPGTYYITYDVSDSEGLAANQKTRTVIVEKMPEPAACSDHIDNDLDDYIDEHDPACHTDGDPENEDSYDPDLESENSKPVITLLGSETIFITIHASFTDPGATAHDEEDGDITNAIVIGGDIVNTNTIGVYVIRYNVSDSQGAGAEEVTRTVHVIEIEPQCSDGSDNDGDTRIDEADPACHTDGDPENEDSYDPNINDENAAPQLVLLGANPLEIVVGNEYTEFGATAHDEEDGDIAQSQIVINANDVNMSVVGTYKVTYNVSDSDGKAADEVTRTVHAVSAPHVPACSDNRDNDTDGKIDEHDPACHTDGNSENEDSYNPDLDSENSKPALTLLGDNPLTIPTGNGYLEPGAVAFDEEDGIIPSEQIVVGGDTVNPNVIGAYTVTYNVTDSDGLAANEITRAVHVIEEQAGCSDNLDNDSDGKTDEDDAGCHTDGDANNPNSYDPADEDENAKPVITLLGNQTITLTKNDAYTDAGATAFDEEDGDITDNIVTENNVNTGTPGAYTVVYRVTDSSGLAADQVTRAVTVNAPQTTGGNGGGSSSGGGGGGTTIFLEISNEQIAADGTGSAIVTWNTNLQATSMVVYDFVSRGTPITPPLPADYAFTTPKSTAFVTSHSVTITGLVAGQTYYFRPYSDRSNESKLGIELSIHPTTTPTLILPPAQTDGTAPQVSNSVITRMPCAEYLTSYIKLGAANNPDDVRKLKTFLNAFEGFNLSVDGIYNPDDHRAVVEFQERHVNDILAPWGYAKGTGYVYYTTRKYINEKYCKDMFPLTEAQLTEIAEFKKLWERIQQSGGSLDTVNIESTVGSRDKNEGEEKDSSKESEIAQQADTNDSGANLAARLQDALKDRMRAIGIILILFAILLAGGAGIRAWKQK